MYTHFHPIHTNDPDSSICFVSDSVVCIGDSAHISLINGNNFTITPNYNVTWIDDEHAKCCSPDTTTTYTITAQNFNGIDTNYITIGVHALPQVTLTANSILCHGGSTTVSVQASGDNGPYWGTGNYTATAGTQYYLVTDNIGCATLDSITISQPPQLGPNISNGSIRCFGDSTTLTVTATGGTPPYTGTGVFYVPAGVNQVVVRDSNGCQVALQVNLSQPPPLIMQIDANAIACYGDSSTVLITAFGGTPGYTGTGPYMRPAGAYTFVVTDLNDCTVSGSVDITQPAQLHVSISTPITSFCPSDAYHHLR